MHQYNNNLKIAVSCSVTTTALNTKSSKVKNKIPVASDLVTTTVLDTKIKEVKNEIPVAGGLVKKIDPDVKISEIKGKYFTTSDYNKFTEETIGAKIKEKELVDKSDIFNLTKKLWLKHKTWKISNKSRIESRAK